MKRFYFILLLLTCFSSAMLAQLNGSGFYRLRSGSATDKYMSIINDTISAQKIVGSLSSLQSDDGRTKAMNRVQPFLQTDLKLVNQNSIFTDPGTIIYLEKQSGISSNYDFLSQGVGLKYISTCVFVGTNAHAWGLKGMPATINSVGNNLYTAYVNLSLSYSLLWYSYSIDETRFLGAESGKVVMTSVDNSNNYSNAPATCHWYIEPLNLTDNYFAAAPVSSFTQNGKYYTTLRTAFSYKVPSGSDVKVYKVTGMPTVEGELAETEEVTQGKVIPAGLPIIIESTSLEPANNKLEPYFNSSTAPIVKSTANYDPASLLRGTVTSASISVTGCANSDVLYNGYGHHGHDCYTDVNHNTNSTVEYGKKLWPGWAPEGDNIGFFKNFVRYYDVSTKKWTVGTPSFYKLGIKDGAVGFWDLVQPKEVISGNEAYSPVQCQLFPVEKELADIGAQDISYKVTNPLIVAYEYVKDNGNRVIYAKDNNGKPQQLPSAGEIDFMKLHYADNTYHDHSNWVAIETGATPSVRPGDSRIEVTGKVLESSPNLRMKASLFEEIDQNGDFNPNTYCVVNFMDKSNHSTANNNFFFAAPQANEIADIIWAQWDGNDTFIVPPHSGFTGGIKVDFSMYEGELPFLQDGHEYSFRGLIEKLEPSTNAIAPKDVENISNHYKVYPLNNLVDMEEIATGVTNNVATSKVVSVKYYNVMGVASDEPFEGVNIVVTTYDNGISTRSKILK